MQAASGRPLSTPSLTRANPGARQIIVRLFVTLLLALVLSGASRLAGEAVENGIHWLDQGHLAHADVHPEGDPGPGPEHGCTGTSHHCTCCMNAPVLAPIRDGLWPPTGAGGIDPLSPTQPACDGFRARVERPPRA